MSAVQLSLWSLVSSWTAGSLSSDSVDGGGVCNAMQGWL